MPTLRQLENFARAVHVPFGYLFLPEPPVETLPIPDFRTVASRAVERPSPNLLDTIYLCQQRQDWFKEYARIYGIPAHPYVGSVTISDDPVQVAGAMREALNLSIDERQNLSTFRDALRELLAKAEAAGVLMMASSIVGSNSHRKLAVEEFRGFTLVDKFAPLIFINARDSKSAQMFTLAHELAHVWLGQSGVSDPMAGHIPGLGVERWCNAVAAEFLVPLEMLTREHNTGFAPLEEARRLSRVFKVSTFVTLRRLFDAGEMDYPTLQSLYAIELDRINQLELNSSGGGGDFYRTLGARTGKRFARAVVSSTLEGHTLFKDAFQMLGVRKTSTFYAAARELGVVQ